MNAIAKVAKSSGRGSLPGERRGGRQNGTPNKITANLKSAILGALEAKGGQAYLEKVADNDPRTFCALLGKILPTQIEPSDDNSQQLIISWIMKECEGTGRGLASDDGQLEAQTRPIN